MTESSLYGNDGISGSVKISLNNYEREVELPMRYFTRTMPSKYCDNVPILDRIGLYSFALHPLDHQPSGHCNFSNIKLKQIELSFANNNVDFVQSKGEGLIIFAVNYNILRFTQGKADLLYHRHHISQKNLYYGV